jgi:hypothetical protein
LGVNHNQFKRLSLGFRAGGFRLVVESEKEKVKEV